MKREEADARHTVRHKKQNKANTSKYRPTMDLPRKFK